MQLILRTLIILQTIAVELAALAAMDDVETAPISGPMLAASGLIVAYLSFRRNRPCGLCFGSIAPTAYVLSFSLISGLGWSKYDAWTPMFVIVAVVAAFHVVAAFLAIGEIAATLEDNRPKLPFQFSIFSMLVLMLLVSIFFGSYQTFGPAGAGIGALFAYAVILTYLLRQFHLMRVRQKEELREKSWPSASRDTAIRKNEGASREQPAPHPVRNLRQL